MPGRLQFDFTFGKNQTHRPTPSPAQGVMRILLMGDFSGRSSRGADEPGDKLAERRVYNVDIDNFSAVISRIAPHLHLALGGSSEPDVIIPITQFDDFHPDHLYSSLSIFRTLKALRQRLTDTKTFAEATSELQRFAQLPPIAAPSGVNAAPAPVAVESDEDLLDRILGSTQGSTDAPPIKTKTAVQRLIKDIVAPYSEPAAAPHQAQYVAALDDVIGNTMRAMLHHPEFQALEALWRSVHSLVHGLEADQALKLYLLDVSKQELNDDITATQEELEHSQLYQLLQSQGPGTLGGEPWSTFVGAYTFTLHNEDLSLLGSLGAIGSQFAAPFIAAADASFLGCQSLVNTPDPRDWHWQPENNEVVQNWQTLRTSKLANWIGLVQPRVLLRLPYSKNCDPLDSFAFEELGTDFDHAAFLWGNPALTCAHLIMSAYQTRGWSMQLGDVLAVDNLPAYTYQHDGESTLLACAEVFLSDRAAETMLERGIMPLVSYRNRNTVRLMRFQSIADPATALAGPWS